MNDARSGEKGPSGASTADLATRINAELRFFEGAADRARLWRTAWEEGTPEVREELASQQAGFLEEILARDESLQEIYRTWRDGEGQMGEVEREQVRRAVRRLDQAMQDLLRIQKEILEGADEARRELLRGIEEVRTAREAHSSYRGRDKPSPHCVDRKL